MNNRRSFLQTALSLSAGALASVRAFATSPSEQQHRMQNGPNEGCRFGKGSRLPRRGNRVSRNSRRFPVALPNRGRREGVSPWLPNPVKRQLIPGRDMEVWGYKGSFPSPTIQGTKSFATSLSPKTSA